MKHWMWRGAVLLAAGLAVACQEKLVGPADCPSLCPGGQLAVHDTTISPIAGGDSSFSGYVSTGVGISLLASNGLQGDTVLPVIHFLPMPDSLLVSDTNRSYTVDSAAFTFNLSARDTTVGGLRFLVYRLPAAAVDSATTYATAAAELTPANLVDTLPVADTLASGQLRLVLSGAQLSRIAIPDSAGGELALALVLDAPQPTGVRLGSLAGGSGPVFARYVTADVADTTLRHQTITRVPKFNGFLEQNASALDPDLLTVGGAPSSRAFLRFSLPPLLDDSAHLLRVTLELTLAQPAGGLPGDTALVVARDVLGDLGRKSPLYFNLESLAQVDGVQDSLSIDVTSLVKNWQSSSGVPELLVLSLRPEASSFSRPVFFSTRSPTGRPRLRISYTLSFPFERP